MTYKETLDFLYAQLPMYSRIGKAAYKSDITNTVALCALLNHPEKKFKSIHIAGTNGKGSTSHMLAAILQTAGYKTGLYTSPHLKDFRERIRINGEMIPQEEVVSFVEQYQEDVSKIGCSFFEWTVGLAFNHFAKHQVDISVIETGLGGRLDSTNVITPLLSIITNISWDHSDLLGDTLEKIATEKAGIIKHGVPIIIGERQPEVENVFISKAEAEKAPLIFASDEWKVHSMKPNHLFVKWTVEHGGEVSKMKIDLTGEYQKKNLPAVLEACSYLRKHGFEFSDAQIANALIQVKSLTVLRGRWDVLREIPTVIADVAHNEAGLRFSMEQLKQHSAQCIRFVIGFVNEKDLNKILPLFPTDALYYFCSPNIPRGYPENKLKEEASRFNLKGKVFESVESAYSAALNDAGVNDLIYVGGSTFVVAEVI